MKVVLLHNLCTYNLEPNSKDNSEYAVLCSLQAGHASPVKWCLNEKVELPCKLAMPRLSSGVRKKRFCEGNGQQLQCWSYNIYV